MLTRKFLEPFFRITYIMKKVAIIIISVIAAIFLLLILIPVLFKEQIFNEAKFRMEQNLDAQVNLNLDQISISGLRAFPSLSVAVRDLTIVGKGEFEKDTLYAASNTIMHLNLWKILVDKEPEVNLIRLENPSISVKVLAGGKANYDIYLSDNSEESELATDEASNPLALKRFEVVNAKFRYDDQDLKFSTFIEGLDATGDGDFTADIFDVRTVALAEKVDMMYDGISYLSKKEIALDATLGIDLLKNLYQFKENTIRINQFIFNTNGQLTLLEEGVDFDMSFATDQNEFKNLLSLVQGIYNEGFEGLSANGTFDFDAGVKGIYAYDDSRIPSFNFDLAMENGNFKYPDLPSAVEKVNLKISIVNTDGIIDNTSIDIPNFSATLGKNPVTGRLKIANLRDYEMDGQLKAAFPLQELMDLFPMEGYSLAGDLDLDVKAQGIYDSTRNIIPTIDGLFKLTNGSINTPDLPAPIEQLNFTSTILNTSRRLADTRVSIEPFSFTFQGEPLEGKLLLTNLEDYTWDAFIKGNIDLEQMSLFAGLAPGTVLKGKLNGELSTKGKYSDLENERYSQLPTSGKMDLKAFSYKGEDFPEGITIPTAELVFNPTQLSLNDLAMTAGGSDFKGSGYLTNYLSYFLGDDSILKGRFTTQSNYVNLNEWMKAEDPNAPVQPETNLQAFIIPENIDIELVSGITKLDYEKFNLNNVKGVIKVKDGVAQMNNVEFEMLNGKFALNGSYDTKDKVQPAFNFDFAINDMPIKSAFMNLETVQAFAPIARHAEGLFNTSFKISGLLGQDLMPVMTSLNGAGLVRLLNANLQDAPIVNTISQFAKINLKNMAFKDLIMKTEFKDGKLSVQPFNVAWGDYSSVISGSTGFDGSLDYAIALTIPASKFGTTASGFLSNMVNRPVNTANEIKLDLAMTGTYSQPRISLENRLDQSVASFLGINMGGRTAGQMMTDTLQSVRDSLAVALKQRTDSLRQVVQDSLRKEADAAKNRALRGIGNMIRKEVEPPKKDTTTVKIDTTKVVKPDTTKTGN